MEYDQKMSLTDLFFFDGASNVQKAGQVLMAMFPRTFCFHGGGNMLSLSSSRISQELSRSGYRALRDFSDPRRKTKIGIRRKHTSFLRRSDIGQFVTCDELISPWCLLTVL